MASTITTESRAGIWRAGLVAAGTAVVINAVIYQIGRAAAVSFAVVAPFPPAAAGQQRVISFPEVLLSTAIPFVLGITVTALVASRVRWGVRAMQTVGALVALLSLTGPLSLDAQASTKVLLASMHLVTGAAFVSVLDRA